MPVPTFDQLITALLRYLAAQRVPSADADQAVAGTQAFWKTTHPILSQQVEHVAISHKWDGGVQ